MSDEQTLVKIVNLTPLALQVLTQTGDESSNSQNLASFMPLDYPRPATAEIAVKHLGRIIGKIPKEMTGPLIEIDEAFIRSSLATLLTPNSIFKGRFLPKTFWWGKLTVKNLSDETVVPYYNGERAVQLEIEPGKETTLEVQQYLANHDHNKVDYVVFRGAASGESVGMVCPSSPAESITLTNEFRNQFRRSAKDYYPQLHPGNFNLVQASVPQPDQGDSAYIRHGQEKVFNGVLNGLNRDLFRVTIYGVRLVFDNKDKSSFLKDYNGREDIQDLYIFGDHVRIETDLRFPQTNVHIFCRELSFSGAGSFIDTTPISTEYRNTGLVNGEDGAKAGDITLNIQSFSTDTTGAKHFRAVGGKGQNPDEGGVQLLSTTRHIKPISVDEWNEFFSHKRRKLLKLAAVKMSDPAGVDPLIHSMLPPPQWKEGATYVEFYNTYEFGVEGLNKGTERYLVGTLGTQDLPGKGPAGLTPGKPGTGGAGGTLTATAGSFGNFHHHANLSGGPSGTPLAFTPGGLGGTPSPAWWYKIEANAAKEINFSTWTEHHSQRGDESGPGPRPDKPEGDAGQIVRLTGEEYFYAWLTEINLTVAIQYAKDLVATGFAGAARKFLAPYVTTLQKYKDKLPDDFYALELEATNLTAQAEQYQDAYGNPPGWVPALSLESAASIYEAVLKSSMQELYTAYYLEKLWLHKKDKQDAIRNLIGLLSSKTQTTQASLVETRRSIPKLIDEVALLVDEMKTLSEKLKARAEELRRQADKDAVSQQQKEDMAAAFKIAGAVVKAIPLPEPYQTAAGAVGGLLDVTSTFIDKGGDDDAFKALQEQVSAFSAESTDALVTSANEGIEAQLKQDSPEIKKLEDEAEKTKQAKERLEGTYADQVNKYTDVVAKKREVLEAKLKVLENARSDAAPSAKLAAKWTQQYQAFEAQQKSLLVGGAATYLELEEQLKGETAKVTKAKEDLGQQKETLEAQKATNAKQIKDGIDKVKKLAASVATIGQTVNKLIVSKGEVNKKFDAALAKAKITDPEFLNLTRQIKYLDVKKEELAKSLSQQQTELVNQQNLISKNLVIMNEMRAQLSSTSGSVDPSALAYVQSVGQDAHQQLARFLYYVVKAYEYYTLEPWPDSYRAAQKLFDSLRKTMEPSDFKFDFDNDQNGDQQQRLQNLLSSPDPRNDGGMLKPEEFTLLRMVYEKPLRDMGKKLASHLMSGAGRLIETPKMIVLGASYLEDLNRRILNETAAQQISFSLVSLCQLDQSNERQRIANMEVASVRCKKAKPETELPATITFKFTHLGKSIVRANGKFFAFDPEGKAISSDLGGKPVAGRPIDFITLGGNRTFTDKTGRKTTTDWKKDEQGAVLSDDALWQPSNLQQENLLSNLLAGSDGEKQQLLSLSGFRPGIFSDFLFEVEISPPNCKVSFEEIRLQLTFEAGSAPIDEMLLCMDNNLAMAIPVSVDASDESGRTGGTGRYLAIYNRRHLKGDKIVHVSVPAEFGEYVHAGWLVDGQSEAKKMNSLALGKSAYLVANYVKKASEKAPVAGTN